MVSTLAMTDALAKLMIAKGIITDQERKGFRRTAIMLTIYGVGLAEAYYLPRYGIEWLLGGIAVTVILASFWIKSYWA